MRHIILSMIVLGLSFSAERPALALGGESLGCFVNDGLPATFDSPECLPTVARTSYGVVFKVLGGSGSYTYSWSVGGGGAAVTSGCTTSSDTCILQVNASSGSDKTVNASVTLTQGGQQVVVSAVATIPAVCNFGGMLFFC
jgi:hypothetical protein